MNCISGVYRRPSHVLKACFPLTFKQWHDSEVFCSHMKPKTKEREATNAAILAQLEVCMSESRTWNYQTEGWSMQETSLCPTR